MNALPAVSLHESHRGGTARRIKKKKVLKLVRKSKAALGLLTAKEREQMVLNFREKGRSLAHSILRKWHSRLDPQEVESIVDLSLCEAVRRFNKRKGASFVTFLFYHLRGNLIRAVSTAATLNFVPLPDLDQAEGGLESTGRAKLLGALELSEQLSRHDHESPDESLQKKQVAHLSSVACSKLDPLEREVIYRIYILEQQLMDIARSLGYSRCHISRVKRKALEALHSELAPVIHPDSTPPAPDYADEEQETSSRKLIHRRKPRSKKIFERRSRAKRNREFADAVNY